MRFPLVSSKQHALDREAHSCHRTRRTIAHSAFYASAPAHLLGVWLALGGLIALYSALTLLALRRADHYRRTG